mmetsp:Transcript_107651/g.185620  ORF Transcript_107651/g.185620 Transcript_107651/m.185620 type:complete len:211 (-) Transcript_107651:742-1374(-)
MSGEGLRRRRTHWLPDAESTRDPFNPGIRFSMVEFGASWGLMIRDKTSVGSSGGSKRVEGLGERVRDCTPLRCLPLLSPGLQVEFPALVTVGHKLDADGAVSLWVGLLHAPVSRGGPASSVSEIVRLVKPASRPLACDVGDDRECTGPSGLSAPSGVTMSDLTSVNAETSCDRYGTNRWSSSDHLNPVKDILVFLVARWNSLAITCWALS